MGRHRDDIYIGIDGTGWESKYVNGEMPLGRLQPFVTRKMHQATGADASAKRSMAESAEPNHAVGPKQKENIKKGGEFRYMDIGRNPYYAKEFLHGNVYSYWRQWHGRRSYYVRGPEAEGESVEGRMQDAFRWYEQAVRYTSGRVFLFGYSRGRFAVVRLAEKMEDAGIRVHALCLFDAVKRTMAELVQKKVHPKPDEITALVPENVRHCLHLRRNPDAGSRAFMGNCSLGAKKPRATKMKVEPVWGTHSAMGGLPYAPPPGADPNGMISEVGTGPTFVSYNQDLACSRIVKNKVNTFLAEVL